MRIIYRSFAGLDKLECRYEVQIWIRGFDLCTRANLSRSYSGLCTIFLGHKLSGVSISITGEISFCQVLSGNEIDIRRC